MLALSGAAGARSTGEWLTDYAREIDNLRAALDWAHAADRQALDGARRQGALSCELRAATSLARLLRDQGRSADAIACLQPIYDRFTEGFGTADLMAAKQLLGDLADAGGS